MFASKQKPLYKSCWRNKNNSQSHLLSLQMDCFAVHDFRIVVIFIASICLFERAKKKTAKKNYETKITIDCFAGSFDATRVNKRRKKKPETKSTQTQWMSKAAINQANNINVMHFIDVYLFAHHSNCIKAMLFFPHILIRRPPELSLMAFCF